jgi:asparagine synthase (glutamine-hydrolysing)
MCGVTGFLDFGRTMSAEVQARTCRRMADALAHRGPDDQGVWTDPASGVALGHRRLAILDLTQLGHQPMTSESGRYVVSYNGEIYNFAALREELAGHQFRGTSDTEVLLAAFEEWGVEAALPRFNGMFAVALWDARDRALWLARDRFGEKPLYYGRIGHKLVFGSELKAVRAFPGFEPEIDRGALTQFLRFGYVPGAACIFRGMRKLPPASYLRIATESDIGVAPSTYWSLEAVAREGALHPFRGSDEEGVRELEALLTRAVKLRMVADVPLGAFLSGGIDSATVVAMMQVDATQRLRTFTIGLDDEELNEADDAKRIAQHLGTDHTELYVSSADAQSIIPRLPALYDEPFADPSQIPTYLVSSLARRSVTVALSGDGGDELFGGYNWYFGAEARWRRLRELPPGLRRAGAAIARLGRGPGLDQVLGRALRSLPASARARLPGELLPKLLDLISVTDSSEVFLAFQSAWTSPSAVTGVVEPAHPVFQIGPPQLDDFTARMMCTDLLAYLPDDILVKVDRAAMGVSLETRVPLLDPEVARFAWSLPKRLKVGGGTGKLLLREVLARHVPRALFEGPKRGFTIPIASWLRGPLRDWAESQLSAERLRSDGFFEPAALRRKWAEHLSGMRNSEAAVWYALMFQAWFASWGGQTTEAAA